jgi:exodeoxyribonuclease V alpha subunit
MPRTVTTGSTEVLAGLVDRVTFHNPENGFCVLRVKARASASSSLLSDMPG